MSTTITDSLEQRDTAATPGSADIAEASTQHEFTPESRSARRRRAKKANSGPVPYEFYASCPEGFELALTNELKSLGLTQVRRLKGRVTFAGPISHGYRACLWSRLASRVFVLVGRFGCYDAQDLYENAEKLPWEAILAPHASIAITVRGVNDELRNSHFTAQRLKDAICDHLIDATGTRPVVDTENPDARLLLSIRNDKASLHLDLSGDPLFKRLPRDATRPGAAHILRPDYAALALSQTAWPNMCTQKADSVTDAPAAADPLLIDFSCAGGGIELEAANMLLDRAPGLSRTHWGFEGWSKHDPELWTMLLDEARERETAAAGRSATIIAADPDRGSAEFARKILRKSGLGRFVTITTADLPGIQEALERTGANPAWTGRAPAVIADALDTSFNHLPALFNLASGLRGLDGFEDARLTVLTHDDMLSRVIGCEPSSNIRVMPNNEEALLLTYKSAARQQVANETAAEDAAPAARAATPATTFIDLGNGRPVPVLIPESEQFAARLRKVYKQRRKWAAREGITCYRVYDADLPDYSAAIDLYEGAPATPGRWLVIAEYAAPKSVDASLAQARMLDILTIAPRILDIPEDHVYAKARTRSRGGSQYGKKQHAVGGGRGGDRPNIAERRLPLIEEGGLTFAVNFDDYLDTGIFLDHRITRDLIREHARGKRYFLNLFAYTGTATCYAADAGVEETVTVDMSNTYLDWAERNMSQNGFTGNEHHFVRADVMRWVEDMRHTYNRWDLIFCDPPTFSNGGKMGQRTWDVQRDHSELLIGVSRLLSREGEAIFSCNLRTFRPDIEKLAHAGVVLTDITEQTIPEDFKRNQRIHRCYIVRRYTPEEARRLAGVE